MSDLDARRIQRKRTKGWRIPPGAIYVGRPTRWGNPWHVYQDGTVAHQPTAAGRALAVAAYREWLEGRRSSTAVRRPPPTLEDICAALAGHDLACWCPLDQPCHADILLELAR